MKKIIMSLLSIIGLSCCMAAIQEPAKQSITDNSTDIKTIADTVQEKINYPTNDDLKDFKRLVQKGPGSDSNIFTWDLFSDWK